MGQNLQDSMKDRKYINKEEHILVCLSSAPSNARIIRTAAHMAKAFGSQFTALFVETPDFAAASQENKERLQRNRKLAEELGAHIETVYGEDIPYQIAEFARISGVTRIVLGRSAVARRHLFGKPTLTDLLLSYAPEIDIHIIPDQSAEIGYKPKKASDRNYKYHILKDTATSVLILVCATLLSVFFHEIGFTKANIIMVYILGVLVTSIVTSHQICSLLSSVASVFLFNYLFTEPRFSLTAYETGYPITFVVMFLTAYITGTFASRYKEQARQSAKIARRTKVLFDTDKMLSKAHGREEILEVAAEQIRKLLGRNIVILEDEDERLTKAGHWFYRPIHVNEHVYGVIGIDSAAGELDASEYDVLLSILGETALALENDRNLQEKEAAAIMAEREQLRANLLRSISHDLRTPLTTISGNADNLLNNGECFDYETKQQIYSDIYNDSMWLIDLVENLLYSTRIEDGCMSLKMSTELLSDIVEEAIQRLGRKAAGHKLEVVDSDDFLFVKADVKLIVQVITNIVDNALKYTPRDTTIVISTDKKDGYAGVCIADNGRGISDDEKIRIFDKFYCSENKIADNRRSLGLGLYLCKAIIEAHGGEIHAEDNVPNGTVFVFTLPLEEVTIHE